MKVYISVDIEGVAGITHWDEAQKNHPDYAEFREQMTREAVAAIEGAEAAGATEIWVKDAHDSGRNLITSMLPANIRLIRSWAGHPLCMVQELDPSFDAVMMVGYHAAAGSEANALAHTLSLKPHLIRLNGRMASEFYIHALAGSLKRSPEDSLIPLPQDFVLEVTYANPVTACRMQWYPGASHSGERTIRFATKDYFDILRMLNFVT